MNKTPAVMLIAALIAVLILIMPVSAEGTLVVRTPEGPITVTITDNHSGRFIVSGVTSPDPALHDWACPLTLNPGLYTVTGSRTGYTNQTSAVRIVDGQTETVVFSLPADMSQTHTQLFVTSNVDLSTIVISNPANGERTCVTGGPDSPRGGPYNCSFIDIPADCTYQVTLYKTGYRTINDSAYVPLNRFTPVSITTVADPSARDRSWGTLIVRTLPNECAVRIRSTVDSGMAIGVDGVSAPTTDGTPQYQTILVPTEYEITVSKAGYHSLTQNATVIGGRDVTISFVLSPVLGSKGEPDQKAPPETTIAATPVPTASAMYGTMLETQMPMKPVSPAGTTRAPGFSIILSLAGLGVAGMAAGWIRR